MTNLTIHNTIWTPNQPQTYSCTSPPSYSLRPLGSECMQHQTFQACNILPFLSSLDPQKISCSLSSWACAILIEVFGQHPTRQFFRSNNRDWQKHENTFQHLHFLMLKITDFDYFVGTTIYNFRENSSLLRRKWLTSHIPSPSKNSSLSTMRISENCALHFSKKPQKKLLRTEDDFELHKLVFTKESRSNKKKKSNALFILLKERWPSGWRCTPRKRV